MNRKTKRVMQGLALLFCLLVVPLAMGLVAGTVVTNHILFDNFSLEINADTADEIEFRKIAGEDISLNLGTSNTLTLTSDSGVVNLALGDVDAVSGIESLTGEGTGVLTGFLHTVEVVTTQTNALTAAESGKVIVSSYTGTQTHTLPDAAAGLYFMFVDNSATAADDVVIDCQAADNIDGDTNGDAIESVTDALGQNITLFAVDGTRWVTISKNGTWGAQ